MRILAILLCLSLGYLVPRQVDVQAQIDPADGFTSLPLNQSNFEVQRPYDVPVDQRYSFEDGVHKLWVFDTDKPHTPTSQAELRTKIRVRGYDYSSGRVWQFEGHGYVPSGTSGVCIMQIFGAVGHATTSMLRVYNGTLYYYRSQVLVENIYNKWFKLNVIHDVDDSNVKIYMDDQLRYEVPDRGGDLHYFKFGVYAQDNSSHCMESLWKDVKVLKKN